MAPWIKKIGAGLWHYTLWLAWHYLFWWLAWKHLLWPIWTAMVQVVPPRAVCVSSEWRKEWRRYGGAVMTVAFLAGAGWVSATQSFVTVANGNLVHPSIWQWPLWLCIAGAVIGLYIVLTTYHDQLPMFGRERAPDHETKYSLGFSGIELLFSDEPTGLAARAALIFTNGCRSTIEAHLEDLVAQVGAKKTESSFTSRDIRILPFNTKAFRTPWVTGLAWDEPVLGEVTYIVTYGPPSGSPRFQRSHKIGFRTLAAISKGSTAGIRIDWWDVTPEVDTDLAQQ